MLLAALLVGSSAWAQQAAAPMTSPLGITANDCRACHSRHYQEWQQSFHSRSLVASHGGFKKYITDEERLKGRALTRDELMGCLGCHAPVMRFASDAEITRLVELVKTDQRDAIAGLSVDCITCHSLVASGSPEVRPTATALSQHVFHGTVQNPAGTPHGMQFNAQMGTSEFCKSCHTYVTPADMKVNADWDIVCSLTYDSWAEGPHGPSAPAADRQECQNCHMEKADGRAAEMPGVQTPNRRVSSHLFPGWHNAAALQRATELSVATRPGSGGAVEVVVTINNKAGHRIPDT